MVFYLHDLPPVALGYALLLCAVVLLLALGAGFAAFRRKCRLLRSILEAEVLTAERLPEAADALEEAYQALFKEALRSKALALDARDQRERAMTDYYTLWVHQIKTPISAMRLLLQGKDTDLSRELEVQLFRINQYVEMVLAYLRLGSESRDFVLRPCRVEAVVRQSVKKFAPLFIRSRIKLELGELDLTVVSDEKWLAFALEQLLANAIQYAPRGTVELFCRDRQLVVRDNGIGIAAEDLPRIFEKGYTGLNGRRGEAGHRHRPLSDPPNPHHSGPYHLHRIPGGAGDRRDHRLPRGAPGLGVRQTVLKQIASDSKGWNRWRLLISRAGGPGAWWRRR